MTRYFFHLHEDGDVTRDEEGREYTSIDAARSAAMRDARSIIAADVERGRLDLSGRIEVHDGQGQVVLIVTFEEAVGRLDSQAAPERG
jgi:hypothetical protein